MARIQQVVSNFTAAGQTGPWLKHDFYEAPFCLSFMVTPVGAFAGTLGIDYVVDDFMNDGERPVTVSQAGTTITVNDTGIVQPGWAGGGITHGLAVGDWVQLRGTMTPVDGGYPVASVASLTQYTLTASVSQTMTLRGAFALSARIMQATATDKIVPFAPASARATVGVAFPIVASRLRSSTFTTAGYGVLLSVQGGNLGNRV